MNMQSIIDEWDRGKAWIDNFTRDFPDLDNLADGVSVKNVKNAPIVGSVTLANSVRQIPRSSIQQVPTLSTEVNGTKHSVDAIVANFLLRRVVFNEDTFGNGILSTMQMAAESALTHGFQPLRANTGKIFNQFGTTLETLHYNDIVIEPGVFDASDSSYYHVRTRVTPNNLKRLLKSAKANPNTQWDVEALQELIDSGPQPMDYNRYLSAPRTNAGMGGDNQYDIVTRYGVGPYYPIVVYSPQLARPLMQAKSKSKFGYPRVAFLVIDPAQLSPFGTSRARLASPMTNYGNIYLQSTAKMQLLNADPPVFQRGLFTTPTNLRRGAKWESIDPNADVQIKELSNSTLQQFENVLNFIDRQILSVMGVTSAAGPQANSAYQNTASVQAQKNTMDLASAQVSAIVENSLRQYALTALDLYISEQVGKTPLIIDDEAKDAINQLEGEGFVGNDNTINIDWQAYYDRIQTWTVTIDLSVSKRSLEDKKRADLQDMYTVMKQTANPNDPQAVAQANAIGKELIEQTLPEISKEMENNQPMQAVGGEMPQATGQ